jgi:hypothetical protein
VTLTKHLVSSRDFIGFERNPMKSYRELDLTHFYFSIHFACFCKTNKTLEVTLMQHFVSSSDGEAIAEPLYRELDNPVLLLDTFCWFFVKQTKHSK